MTGKEVAIVLGGAALFGGAAGAGAAALGRADPPAPAPLPDTGALERRLEDLEKSLRDTRRERDELREAVTALRVDVETAAAQAAPAGGPSNMPAFEAVRTGRKGEATARLLKALAEGGGTEGGHVVFGGFEHAGAVEAVALPDEAKAAVMEEFHGIAQGLGRRGLPEADRWKKAAEEVGVSDAQVEDLKAAVADRDRALEEAFVTEKSEGDGNGGSFTLRRMDGEKAAAANRAYADRLDRTLTTDQRSKWKSGGWDHSFGKMPGGGGGAVMTIQAESILHGDVVEEGPK